MAPTTPSCDKPTDLTKLFHDALQNTPGAQLNSTTSNLNQSFDESKKSSFFSGFKWNGSNSVQNSKENLNDQSTSWKCFKLKKIKNKLRKSFKIFKPEKWPHHLTLVDLTWHYITSQFTHCPSIKNNLTLTSWPFLAPTQKQPTHFSRDDGLDYCNSNLETLLKQIWIEQIQFDPNVLLKKFTNHVPTGSK